MGGLDEHPSARIRDGRAMLSKLRAANPFVNACLQPVRTLLV